jgi:hypothetical protein
MKPRDLGTEMMLKAGLKAYWYAAVASGLLFAVPAAADPLCKKLKSKLERDQCECSSSIGGRVEEKDGKVTFQIPSRNLFPHWRACLVARGHSL